LEIEASVLKAGVGYNFSFDIWNSQGECLFSSAYFDTRTDSFQEAEWKPGDITMKVELPIKMFKEGNYFLNVASTIPTIEVLDLFPEELYFKVEDNSSPIYRTGEGRNGIIIPTLDWQSYVG
jgi:lipopolysaccharide transport system ATP-binding protein